MKIATQYQGRRKSEFFRVLNGGPSSAVGGELPTMPTDSLQACLPFGGWSGQKSELNCRNLTKSVLRRLVKRELARCPVEG